MLVCSGEEVPVGRIPGMIAFGVYALEPEVTSEKVSNPVYNSAKSPLLLSEGFESPRARGCRLVLNGAVASEGTLPVLLTAGVAVSLGRKPLILEAESLKISPAMTGTSNESLRASVVDVAEGKLITESFDFNGMSSGYPPWVATPGLKPPMGLGAGLASASDRIDCGLVFSSNASTTDDNNDGDCGITFGLSSILVSELEGLTGIIVLDGDPPNTSVGWGEPFKNDGPSTTSCVS